MAVKLYMDVHVRRAVTKGLRLRGVDVLTAQEDGTDEWHDPDLLDRAEGLGRILFTQDDDFLRLHAAGVNHAGIAYAPQGTSTGDIIRGLMLICQVLDADDMMGHVEYV